jgi:hypothetical protein
MWKFVIAIPLIMHGLANAAGFAEAWLPGARGFSAQPWLLGSEVGMKSGIGRVFGMLWLLTTIGLVAAGAGVLLRAGWWQPVAISAAALSFVVILLWWRAVPPGARFGAFFDLAVIIALAGPWSTRISEAVR